MSKLLAENVGDYVDELKDRYLAERTPSDPETFEEYKAQFLANPLHTFAPRIINRIIDNPNIIRHIASIAAGSVNAQQPPTAALGITLTLQQKVQVPGTSYEFVLGSFELSPDGSASTEALVTALVTWLSANFDLPATYDHPRIVPMSSVAMTNLLYRSFLGDQPREGSVPENQGQSDQRRQVISLYNIPTKTIYLLPEWTGRTPAELSMFVHEMVHHLQNVAHTAYACPQEREALAYEAQEKWLSLFGRDLLGDFKIDPFTLLMNTKCLT